MMAFIWLFGNWYQFDNLSIESWISFAFIFKVIHTREIPSLMNILERVGFRTKLNNEMVFVEWTEKTLA